MRFGNFLFPDCRDPARDGAVYRRDLAGSVAVGRAWGRCDLARRASFRRHLRLCGPDQLRPARWRPRPGTAKSGSQSCRRRCIIRSVLPSNWRSSTTSRKGDSSSVSVAGRPTTFTIIRGSASTITRRRSAWRRPSRSWFRRGPGEGSPPRQVLDPRCPDVRPRPYTKPHPVIIRAASRRGFAARTGPAGPALPDECAVDGSHRRRVELYRTGDARRRIW